MTLEEFEKIITIHKGLYYKHITGIISTTFNFEIGKEDKVFMICWTEDEILNIKPFQLEVYLKHFVANNTEMIKTKCPACGQIMSSFIKHIGTGTCTNCKMIYIIGVKNAL